MSATLPETNPFANPSPLPARMPPFAEVKDADYWPAYEAGMTEQLLEVAAITSNPEPPTFENTIEALERSGQLLSRVATVHFSLTSSDTTPYLEELEVEIAPLLSAHNDRIALDSVLYARIRTLLDRIDELALTPEQHRLLTRTELQFRLQGAALGDLGKERLGELNQQLASLSTEFEQNLLADTNDLAEIVRDPQELFGLGEAGLQLRYLGRR